MANTLDGHKLPDQFPVKGHDNQFVVAFTPGGTPHTNTEDLPIQYPAAKLDHYSDAVKHPGFQAVQAKIAAKEGISKDRAGAILAASSRHASAGAKKANPNLKRVKGK